MQLQGDVGYLIGRNLFTCSECRDNVSFVKATDSKRAFFRHAKFSEKSEGCSRRVGDYTPDTIRRIRANATRYRVGYFQQRAEDYIYISLLNIFQKAGIAFPWFDTCGYLSEDESGWVIFKKVTDENKGELLNYLRTIPFPSSMDNNNLWPVTCENPVTNANDAVHVLQIAMSKATDCDGIDGKTNLEYWFNELSGTDDDEPKPFDIFAKHLKSNVSFDFGHQMARHLSHSQSIRIVKAIYVAAVHMILGSYRTHYFQECVEHLPCFMFSNMAGNEDYKVSLEEQFNLAVAVRSFCEMNSDNKNLKEFQLVKHVVGRVAMRQAIDSHYTDNSIEQKYIYKVAALAAAVFQFTDIQNVCRQFYGDDRNSPAEQELLNYDKKRGFIYVATVKGMEGLWSDALAKKGLASCVKVGYSDDPDRRKKEIAGQIAPPEAVEIIAAYPVMDMKRAENYVHRKLGKWRLSGAREVFGLTADDAEVRVGELLREHVQSETTPGTNGFGKRTMIVKKQRKQRGVMTSAGFS